MWSLADLSELAAEAASRRHDVTLPSFSVGAQRFDWNRERALMGVVNLSRDSWYRESVCVNVEMAARRARVLWAQGADLVDIGAESTLAHATRVGAEQQIARLSPLIRDLAQEGVAVSVETYENDVVEACLKAGAAVLNVTGYCDEERLFRLAAEYQAPMILCFVQGANVREVGDLDLGADPMAALYEYFARLSERAVRAGASQLFLDAGLGFYYRNLQDSADRVRFQTKVFLSSFRLRSLGFPVCHALPHAFEYFGEEVRVAEVYFATLAALGGASLFRTHEVPKVRGVLESMEAARLETFND